MRVQRLLALAASLLLPSASSAQKESSDILSEISNLQSTLTRLNSLLQEADLKADDEIMTHAAMIVQRVRNLVLTADENVDMIKHKRRAERVAERHEELRALRGSRGIGNGEAQFERNAPEATIESAEEQERHLDFQRSLAETVSLFIAYLPIVFIYIIYECSYFLFPRTNYSHCTTTSTLLRPLPSPNAKKGSSMIVLPSLTANLPNSI